AEGYVAEATGDNIFLVKNQKLITPPTYVGALDGITRQAIIDLAGKLNIEVKEIPFTLYDVYTADEVILTGTAAEVIPVIEVDGRTIGDGKPGPIMKKLLQEFQALVKVDGTQVYPKETSLSE